MLQEFYVQKKETVLFLRKKVGTPQYFPWCLPNPNFCSLATSVLGHALLDLENGSRFNQNEGGKRIRDGRYTWNPKGHPCFGGGGYTFKNRGHWGNIYLDLPFVCKMCTFSPTKTYQKGRHFAEDPGIYWVWAPLPGCNRDHQDDYIFRFGDSITTVNLHLPLLLGRGQTQDIPRTPMTSIFEGRPLHIKGHVGSRYILEPPYRIKSHLNVGTRDEK